MQVQRLDQLEACRQIARAWDCMAHGVPFRRTAWLHSWWERYGEERDLFVLQVTDQHGEVVGIAPWFIEYSVRQGHVVRPLGSGETCSDYLGILVTREHEQQVTAALADWLLSAADGERGEENQWDLLDLVSADVQDSVMTRFVKQLESVGAHAHCRAGASCWRTTLPETWDEYLGMLSKSHRKRVRRLDRKWLENGAARLRTVTSSEQLEQAMGTLIELHQQRQLSVGNPGCFASEPFRAFLTDVARRLLREQMLRLHWLEINGDPVAAEFQILDDKATYAYLGGMSSSMPESSPGQLIQIAILKQCIAEGQRAFDFLRGDEAYKRHWMVEQRRCCDYRIIPRRHVAQLRHQVWLAGDTMKHWIRTGLQITGVH